MKTRNILVTTLMLISALSCGCGVKDGGVTHEVENAKTVDVSQIYENSDKLKGQDCGKFTMPEKFTVNDCNNVYKLTVGYSNEKQDVSELEKKGKLLAKTFFPDSYKDENGTVVDNFRYDYTDNNFYCDVDLFDGFSATLDNNSKTADEVTDFDLYNIPRGDDTNQSYSLENGTMTVQQAADFTDKYMAENLKEFTGDLKTRTKYVCVNKAGENNSLSLLSEYTYENIPLDMNVSPLFPANNNDLVYYLETFSEEKIIKVNELNDVCANANYTVKKAEKIDKIISLESAVDILKDQLAENSGYKFTDCELLYCHLSHQQGQNEVVNPDEIVIDTTQTFEFTPVWCFYIEKEYPTVASVKATDTIRVDALTGEVTVAINNQVN